MKKKGLLLVAAVMMTAMVFGQSKNAEQVFKKYAGPQNCTVLTVPKGAIRLAASLQEEDEPEVKAFLNSLESVKIVAAEKGMNKDLYGEVLNSLKGSYEELMTVEKEGEQVRFLMRQEGDVIRELVLLAGEEDEGALIIVKGKINIDDLVKMKEETSNGKGGLAFLTDL